ncbi:MAG: hypothetical protein ACI9MR_000438 [Myxococcota bacterium]|jgi:hypothetical protein
MKRTLWLLTAAVALSALLAGPAWSNARRMVDIAGFGGFTTKLKDRRTGKTTPTSVATTVAAETYPSFSAAKALRDRVANYSGYHRD